MRSGTGRSYTRAARLLRPSVQRRRDRMGNNMQDRIKVLGIVLKAEPIGEYDRRVVILTREKGKISAFARGARKPTSAFLAPTSPFTFGTFELYAGRNSYSVCDISADCYFEELRQDFEGAYYGMYFLELADYCTRENNDEREVLKLLYQSLRAQACAMHLRNPADCGKRGISGAAAGQFFENGAVCSRIYRRDARGKALHIYLKRRSACRACADCRKIPEGFSSG